MPGSTDFRDTIRNTKSKEKLILLGMNDEWLLSGVPLLIKYTGSIDENPMVLFSYDKANGCTALNYSNKYILSF